MNDFTMIKNIKCYGDMSEYATVHFVCEWADGEEFEQMYTGSKGFTTWTELVSYYVASATEEGYTILECESDE